MIENTLTLESQWTPDSGLHLDGTPTSETSIMVVEDEGIVATDLGQRLESMGYTVPAIVGTGEEAVQQALEHQPDLILMDIMLRGEMRGTQAAHTIREQMHVPIVFLTAYSDEDTIRQARLTQPYGYLVKPISEDVLRTTISVALYKHKIDAQLEDQRIWLESVLNSVAEALITTDRLGRVDYMNSAAQGLTGWDIEMAKQLPLADIFPLVDAATGRAVDSAASDPFQSRSTSLELVTNSGQRLPVTHKASPLTDGSGTHNGYVITFGLRT